MNILRLPFGVLLVASFCLAIPMMDTQKSEDKLKDKDYRLPTDILPSNYKIHLVPYLEDEGDNKQFTFTGKCTITMKPEKDVGKIVLHKSEEMVIKETNTLLTDIDNNEIELESKIDYNNVTEFYTLLLKNGQKLKKGQTYEIKFEYIGQMNDVMSGFYRSSYTENNEIKWIATTQFQPTHARKAFPCFDEPLFKATFDVSIDRPSHMHTLGNMPHKEKDRTVEGDRMRDTFKTTLKMSTYLLAFVVSEFKSVSNKTGQDFDVWARPNAYTQGSYSYDIGKKTLKHLEEFTGYKYKDQGMDKMDMVALPDFSAGAMENWGLLTFRETALLYDENVSTELAKQRVATVVAHEQAHMWFGDLVTCRWWEHTWLNEGFARYLQYYATDKAEPAWNLMEQFVVEQQQVVFDMDALTTSKALSSSVGSPGSISAHFDSISYNKGASVIRMMEHIVGTDKFEAAMKKYLRKQEFKTVVPDNLFEALQETVQDSKINISTIMHNWVYKIGYPVINVEQSADKLIVRQERFLLQGPVDEEILYYVPLSYTYKSEKKFNTKPKAFLKDTEKKIELPLPNKEYEWVIFNIKGTGYYRVNYDEHTWKLLSEALMADNFDGIVTLNRAQLVDDALNLARADGELLKYETALNMLDYLKQETSYLPWAAAFEGFNFLYKRLSLKEADRHELEIYITKLMGKLYNNHGFNEKQNDKPVDKYSRAMALSWACKLNHEDCTNNAKDMFEDLQKKSKPVPPNLRSTVYCTALRHGNETTFDFLWGKYLEENVAAEQVLILTALGCTRNKDKLEWYLKESVRPDSKIRKQDASSAFTGVYSGNPENLRIAFDFLKSSYKQINEAYAGMNALGNAITGLATRLTTKELVQELKDFLNEHGKHMGNAAETAEKAIKAAETSLQWNEKHQSGIMKWVREKNTGRTVFGSFLMCTVAVIVIIGLK